MSQEENISQARTAGDGRDAIRQYVQLRDRLLAVLETLEATDGIADHTAGELGEKLGSDVFNLVVVGQFKRGKTCLINALMGADILPVAVVPLTSIATILVYGEEIAARAVYNDGRTESFDLSRIAEFVTETGNPKNIKDVREVVIGYPSPYLGEGVRLIDTPGVGSVYRHNTDVAYQFLPKCDAAIFLLSVDQPVGQAELDFLGDVREYADRIFFLLNKIDYLSEAETEESVEFSKSAIREATGIEAVVFPVSARLALAGSIEGSEEALQKSRLPAFAEVLHGFLTREKGKVLLLSAASGIERMVSHAELRLELERKALETPLEELKEKLAAFNAKKTEIQRKRRDIEFLVTAETTKLVREVLDEDIATFKRDFIPQIEKMFNDFSIENETLPLVELDGKLEYFVEAEVRAALTEWRGREEDRIASAFQAICRTLASRINDITDNLTDFSSQLFSVSFQPVRAGSEWTTTSDFYYKFRDDPVALDLLSDKLTQVVPGLIGKRFEKLRTFAHLVANRLILNKRKRKMLEIIEMQSGRLRHDFFEKLDRSAARFRKETLERIDETVHGIGSAIERGMDETARGEQEAVARRTRAEERAARLSEVREELERIREEANQL